jgi:hypothetical protein
MGSPSASGPSSGPAGMTGTTTVAGKTVKQYGTKKDAEQTRLENFQQGTINRTKDFIKESPVMGVKLLSPIAVYGADVNSKFFTDKVLTSSKAKKNIGYTQSEFAALTADQQNKVFSKYMSERQTGVRDAYGNLMPGVRIENIAHKKADGTMTTREVVMRDNGGAMGSSGQVVQAPTVTSPTTAEVSQSAAADAARDDLLLRKRRAKAVGRSPTIMTGVTGATGSLTLGKPSLLGR